MSKHRELGLTDYEYDLIVEKLGREPNEVELAVFSLMWSEHCGYKHSRRLLKTLPTEGPRLVMGPGENAGAVDVGDGLACAFKVESHNHPSAVEPFEGAATGVGGILRDIFAIGARPIAILDSLRFGEVATSARSRYLLERAVAGIGHYGNSIGIATVGGEIYFEGPYEQNCLVNAMALGLIETDKLIRSAAAGVGNIVVLFGAQDRPRRDRRRVGAGVAPSSTTSEDKRPTVQIGDPFDGEEAARVLAGAARPRAAGRAAGPRRRRPDLLVGRDGGQGRGRARPRRAPRAAARGRTWSRSRSWSRSPRSGCCASSSRTELQEVLAVCARWEVNGDRDRRGHGHAPPAGLRRRRRWSATCRSTALVDECPAYDLEPAEPATPLYPAPPAVLTAEDPGEILLGAARLREPRLAQVGVRAVRLDRRLAHRAPARAGRRRRAAAARPGDDPLTRSTRATATARGPRSRSRSTATAAASPPTRTAARSRPCSSARANLACVGAEPLGLTNCLNFGNPEKPHIAWQLTRAVAGLGDACRAFGIPVVGGNVSLYNEGAEGPIYPTPVVGLVGELPDARARRPARLRRSRATRSRCRPPAWAPSHGRLGAVEAARRGRSRARSRRVDLGELKALHAAIRQAVRAGALHSAHDVAEGGVAVALAECALASGLGATVSGLDDLFGEGPGAFVVSGPAEAMTAFGAAARVIGEVGGDALTIEGVL